MLLMDVLADSRRLLTGCTYFLKDDNYLYIVKQWDEIFLWQSRVVALFFLPEHRVWKYALLE